MPIPQTSPASLSGTLNGLDAQSQADAQAQAIQELLAQHAAAAAQEAQSAGQQYQQAAQAPVPDINGLGALISQLGGNVASVLGRTPAYREQSSDSLKTQRADLLKSRADNLQALRDTWEQKAQAAKQAGDLEAEQNALTKREQLSKTLAQVLQEQHHANALEEIQARTAGQKEVNSAKPAGGGGVYGQAFSQTDPAQIAKAIESGDLPPNLTQYSRLAQGPIATILAKDGFKLGRAQQDFSAVQRHFATLNGRLQLQIRQSANTVLRGLDDVQSLADRLYQLAPSSRNTPINALIVKGTREWGALSPEAQDVATELNGQIATLIPELSNVYSAGGVPTTEAMKLAKQVLNGDWPPNRLNAGIRRERANIQYRVNSINQVGAATPSSMEQGGYQPPSEAAAPATKAPEMVSVIGPNNQTGKVPKGTKLPKGWKLR